MFPGRGVQRRADEFESKRNVMRLFRARHLRLKTALLVLAGLSACSEPPRMNPGMPQVSVITVQPERAPVSTDLPGRVDAVREAQIRARVTGIVQSILFKQGGEVKEGERLFKIDPAPAQAAYDQAAAQLKQAQANVQAARALVKRYAPLVKADAVSRQEYDNAVAGALQGEAAVAAAKAALDSARINLGYTDVVSPISGRIGRPLVTEGALVEATTATQMALVQQLDPIYVDFTQSAAELAQLRQAFASGALQKVGEDAARVEAVLQDGSVYAHPGKLLFTGITVDPGTGKVLLRAEFDNPDQILLPGMFVRVRLEQGINEQALMVPRQALQRTADGRQALMVVRKGEIEHAGQKVPMDVVAQISVAVGPSVGGRVIVTEGLQAGESVIVEGFQKIRPGAPVQASQWQQQGDVSVASASPQARPVESAASDSGPVARQ